jgi:menaquinone-9 beta-reductase
MGVNMKSIYDAVIVGAGPAGAFAAYKLAKNGMRVLLIDKDQTTKRKICGEYLCPQGVQLLNDEGLSNLVQGKFPPLFGMNIHTSGGIKVHARFPGFETGVQGAALNRQIFDSQLVELAKSAGVEIQMGVRLESFERSVDLWQVTTSIGTFTTRVLIGADGRQSKISRLLKNEVAHNNHRVALHCYLQTAEPCIRFGEMHLMADGSYIGIDPTGTHEVNFSLVCDGENFKKFGGAHGTLNHYIRQSADLKSRYGEVPESVQISAVSPIHHRTKSVTPARNVALVGDAAGFVDPLTGEGIYNALLTSQILTEAIINNRFIELNNLSPAFQEYSERYRSLLHQKTMVNRVFQRVIRMPKLTDFIARILLTSQKRADAFIGIIGNVYSPLVGFIKLIS